MQIIRCTIKHCKNYKIGNFTSMSITLVTLNILKLWSKYMIANKKYKKNNSMCIFSVQTPTSLLSLLLNKNNSHIYNQLYEIASQDIWHCQIGYIGLLSFYKLEIKYLKLKLQGKTMSLYPHCAFSNNF